MPPKAAPVASGPNATESEIKLAFAIMKLVARPTSSAAFAKIAEDAGFASGDSVRHLVRRAAEKHDWFSAVGDEAAGGATPRPRKVATPRKKKLAEAAEEGAEDEGTPAKKRARKGKGKAAAAAAAAAAKEETPEEEEEAGDKGGGSKDAEVDAEVDADAGGSQEKEDDDI
ncbi:hypothetical protein CSHISOI_07738 [Colletotrichum shisoi]|uniref:Uncharacterized protein n=1 Tax=Colletotrichum shisoi TaxID=2078593 RepID=A0A5Q4BM99_9PEZI|nr:hypothetical protein CSHISOI_07738 [Colletotrichum shisoi]